LLPKYLPPQTKLIQQAEKESTRSFEER
jgi:hypothetical protein